MTWLLLCVKCVSLVECFEEALDRLSSLVSLAAWKFWARCAVIDKEDKSNQSNQSLVPNEKTQAAGRQSMCVGFLCSADAAAAVLYAYFYHCSQMCD